jgi:hypothetical protein
VYSLAWRWQVFAVLAGAGEKGLGLKWAAQTPTMPRKAKGPRGS